jgi:predicted ATPase
MITSLELINYKSFLNTTVDIKPLTILAGLNSSGKSSVIQAVNMILSCHKFNAIELPDHISPRLQKSKSSKDNFFKLTMQMESQGSLDLQVNIDGETYDFKGNTNLKKSELPFLQYISASRLGPRNVLELNPEYKKAEIGTKGEYIIDYIDKNRDVAVDDRLVKLDKENNRLWENIDAWLQYISPGISLSYEIKRDQKASYPSYNKILPTETGFGLSYTLPVITASLMPVAAGRESLLLLENPEGHLHPRGQAAMGELLSLAASAGKQIICETHSDHIINSVRAAVKEKKVANKQVIILFFENVPSDTEPHTRVTPIVIDGNGSLNDYPDNFMDEWSIQLAKLI